MDGDETNLPYFAYGSNLNPRQMAERCPGHRVIARAVLPDHALRFRGYGRDWAGAVATVEPAEGSVVRGVLFELTPAHYATLDEYEGYDGPGAATNLYERVVRTVVREDGVAVRTLTYAMVPAEEGLPSRRYRDAILEGMLHHHIAKESIESLRAAATAPE
jgi:cation transport regulator ChaC